MKPTEEYHRSWRALYATYVDLLAHLLNRPGSVFAYQWLTLYLDMLAVMRWADLIAATRMHFRATRQPLKIEAAEKFEDVLDANPWFRRHHLEANPLMKWRAEQMTAVEQRYLTARTARSHYLAQSIEPLIEKVPRYRLDRLRHDQIGEVQNVAEQIQLSVPEIGDAFPYTELYSRGDARVRPMHALAHGFVALRTDPIWKVVRPKNGWNCRCYSIYKTRREAIREGWMTAAGHPLFRVKWPNPAAEKAYEIGIPYHGMPYNVVPKFVKGKMFPDAGWTSAKFVAGVSGSSSKAA